MKKLQEKNISDMQLILTVISVACYLISNIIVVKTIPLPLGMTITCAMFVFPITYILSDVFSEVYGYRWSRITCYLAFGMNLLMVINFKLAIIAPAVDYFTAQEALETILGNSPRILIASMLAFYFGDLINDKIFSKMKKKHENSLKGFKTRALLSSFFGNITDTFTFYPIALLGVIPIEGMIITMATEIVLKTGYEALFVPVTAKVAKQVSVFEGVNTENLVLAEN